MKLMIILGFWVGVSAFAAFPEGDFSGKGVKRFPDGKVVEYGVEMKVRAERIDFRYLFTGIDPIDWHLQFTFEKNGFFRVGTIGSGYCGEKMCHWQVTLGEDDVEEWTLAFNGDTLEKLGSRTHKDQKNFWEETLSKR